MGEAEVGQRILLLARKGGGHSNLDRRQLILTRAPIFSSRRRSVPQVACANWVWCSPIRRKTHIKT
jgi:hypothetical protein